MNGRISISYQVGGEECVINAVITEELYQEILEQWNDVSNRVVSFEGQTYGMICKTDIQITIKREDIVMMYFMVMNNG